MDSIILSYKDKEHKYIKQPAILSHLNLFITESLGTILFTELPKEDELHYTHVRLDETMFCCRNIQHRQEVKFWMKHIIGTELMYTYDEINCSYLQKIVTACITTREHYGLIIDHPELYLSPHDCFRLGEFFASILNRKVRLLIHTKSEQLVNSLRYQTYKNKFDTTIHYLNDRLNKITIDSDGWYNMNGERCSFPSGFFDVSVDALLQIGL